MINNAIASGTSSKRRCANTVDKVLDCKHVRGYFDATAIDKATRKDVNKLANNVHGVDDISGDCGTKAIVGPTNVTNNVAKCVNDSTDICGYCGVNGIANNTVSNSSCDRDALHSNRRRLPSVVSYCCLRNTNSNALTGTLSTSSFIAAVGRGLFASPGGNRSFP